MKLSQQVIKAIIDFAVNNVGSSINIIEVVKAAGIKIQNPYCYVQEAKDELIKEGINIRKIGRKLTVERLNAPNPPLVSNKKEDDSLDDIFSSMKAAYDVEPTKFIKVKSPDVRVVHQGTTPVQKKSGLRLIDTETSIDELITLISTFGKYVNKSSIVVSIQIKESEKVSLLNRIVKNISLTE